MFKRSPTIDPKFTHDSYRRTWMPFVCLTLVYEHMIEKATRKDARVIFQRNIAKIYHQRAKMMCDAVDHWNCIVTFKIKTAKMQDGRVTASVAEEIGIAIKDMIYIQGRLADSWRVVKVYTSGSDLEEANQHMVTALRNAICAAHCYHLSKWYNETRVWEKLVSIAEKGELVVVVGDEYKTESYLELYIQLQNAIKDERDLLEIFNELSKYIRSESYFQYYRK